MPNPNPSPRPSPNPHPNPHPHPHQDAAPEEHPQEGAQEDPEDPTATRPDAPRASGGSGTSLFGLGKRRGTHSGEADAGGTWRLPWSARGAPPAAGGGASPGTPLL